MEKIMICFMALLMSFVTKGQQANPSPVLTKEEDQLKSRNQRTATVVIGGLGAADRRPGG